MDIAHSSHVMLAHARMCEVLRFDYVPFTAMISAHFSNFFVTKTKITIWAESTIGISPFLFFLFKSFTGQ